MDNLDQRSGLDRFDQDLIRLQQYGLSCGIHLRKRT